MTRCETQLAHVITDAIAMLRWQVRKPLTADSWSGWCNTAIEAIQECVDQPKTREMVEDDL